MEKELVSIIVPIYNVEAYVERCLRSLLAQTYPQIEIVLVNDGSTDGSDAICTRYADKYPQIRYFRKENKGLSDARNYGMRQARGAFYLFVDSDDYIESDMTARLVEACEREDAQIAVCGYRMEYPLLHLRRGVRRPWVWTCMEALKELLANEQVENFAWGKLYRASLFADITFPNCRFEDVYTIFQVFARAQRVVSVPKALYHYVQRKGSITNAKGMIVKDALLLQEMRAAFAYQEETLRQMFPHERWEAWQNYGMCELLTLVSLLFVKRKEAGAYVLTPLEWESQSVGRRLCERALRMAVRWRFPQALAAVEKKNAEVSAGSEAI